MEELLKFNVYVPSFNRLVFFLTYSSMIKKWEKTMFGDTIFMLKAPQSVYDEIKDLTDECIEII